MAPQRSVFLLLRDNELAVSEAYDSLDAARDAAAELDQGVVVKKVPLNITPEKSKAEKATMPVGKPGSLDGLKMIFTGTFKRMDRKTCESTAKKYGAEIVRDTKLAEADLIVVGERAGNKKLEEIEEKDLKTIDEAGFLAMIESGEADVVDQDDAEEDSGDENLPAKKRTVAPKKTAAVGKKGAKAKTSKDDEDDEDDEAEAAAPKKAVAAPKKAAAAPKKTVTKRSAPEIEGTPGSLEGLSMLFTGTMSANRKEMEAAAIKCGAKIVRQLKQTDLIVLGTKPGPDKVAEIDHKEYKTCTEADFFEKIGFEPSGKKQKV